MRPAIFLDRDGTIIEQVHHLNRVDDVIVYPFAADALREFQAAGFATVIVTNQSAIGRGLLDEAGLMQIHEEMFRQLGNRRCIDGIYYCPTVPVCNDPRVVEDMWRKPGPAMLERAAEELGILLNESWMIGDAISDMLAGRNAGCRGTVLVRTGYGHRITQADAAINHSTDNLLTAARLILKLSSRINHTEPNP